MLSDQEVLNLAEAKALGIVDEAVQLPFLHGLINILYPSKDIIGIGICQILADQFLFKSGHAELTLNFIEYDPASQDFNKFIKSGLDGGNADVSQTNPFRNFGPLEPGL